MLTKSIIKETADSRPLRFDGTAHEFYAIVFHGSLNLLICFQCIILITGQYPAHPAANLYQPGTCGLITTCIMHVAETLSIVFNGGRGTLLRVSSANWQLCQLTTQTVNKTKYLTLEVEAKRQPRRRSLAANTFGSCGTVGPIAVSLL